ncbi:MAG: hypothetical protein QOE45_654 [Frankiaceae bacterium]|jgi:DNA-directed RNA polymerase specialized sigma24 family protein|nr:hypothetical protein [Frankiaceae bacterium]
MQAEEFFATEWAHEVPRLRRMLARNGVPADDVDDVLQDAAARLYAAWGRVFDDRPVRPLITTIALNAARDHHRRADRWARPVGALPDDVLVDASSVDRVVLARLDVARAGRALAAMPDDQRRTVVDAVCEELVAEEAGRHRSPAAVRMARTRARRKLVAVMELTAGAVGIACAWLRRAVSSPTLPAGAALAAGAALLASVAVWQPAAGATGRPLDAAYRTGTATTGAGPTATAGGLMVVGDSIVVGPSGGLLTGTGHWSSTSSTPFAGLSAMEREEALRRSGSGSACTFRIAGYVGLTVPCRNTR